MLDKEVLLEMVPDSWHHINMYSYHQLLDIQKINNDNNKEYNGYERLLEELSILLDIDADDEIFYTLTREDCKLIEQKLSFTKHYPKTNFSTDFEFENIQYKLINLNFCTVSEYIILKQLCKDIQNNWALILTVLYRRYKYDEFNNIIFEELNFDLLERSDIFYHLDMSYYSIYYFIDFQKRAEETYLTTINDENIDIDELEENERLLDLLDDEEEIEEDNFYTRAQKMIEEEDKKIYDNFSWDFFLLNLANNDILKVYDYYKLPILHIFSMYQAIVTKNSIK